jgi:hypothetical protein
MTWTAPDVDRAPSPRLLDERACLQGWLDFHRSTLLGKCSGLTHEQLALRSVEPSRMSLLGLVRHMAEVEAWWFRTQVAATPAHGLFGFEDDSEWDDLDSVPASEVLTTYAEQCRLADEAVRDLPLEHTFENPWWGKGAAEQFLDLRWVYLHMIEEYARHNGHADLLRERIDGATGD